jgi:GYF domain 2
MNAQTGERHWFISRDGKRYGPYTFEALVAAAAKGVIDADTVVWRLGWVQWHPASSVPGLIAEQLPRIDDAATPEQGEAPHRLDADEVPPLADEDAQQARDLDQPQARRQRAPLRRVPQPWRNEPKDAIEEVSPQADTPETAPDFPPGERVANDDGRADKLDPGTPSPDAPARSGGLLDVRPQRDDLAEVRPLRRETFATDEEAKPRRGGGIKRAAIGLVVLLVLAGAGWGAFRFGLIDRIWPQPAPSADSGATQSPAPEPPPVPVKAAGTGLPEIVATLPAVQSLAANAPADYDRFTRRFKAAAVNAKDDELLSVARFALRKSVKRLLANASGDTLLEITETYLAYMKELATTSPESCVALSDENKGAKLTANFAKDFPILFIRDMAVLERIAATDPAATVTPLTGDQARPYLETVFKVLRSQAVQSDLLNRDKLTPAEYLPYCRLVITFYDAVLGMPKDDKVNLLRYLYAAAASDADDDVPK